MPAPASIAELTDLIRKSGVVDDKRLTTYLDKLRAANTLPPEPNRLAGQMVADGMLTTFQAEQFLMGKWRRFTIGKYKVLERLGAGGMGSVYLCEHKLMRRRVAVKVLPTAKAEDPAALERFYREARAVAALDHPNIVRAYDIDQDEKLHFLVMEHVDGANLQEMLKRAGPMDVLRACHYMRQAALGLQHAHEAAGLVHRDIKPGNILVDRNGIVKILDMGLARFFHDEEDLLTKKYDENVLGTADYLAPEQALDSHAVDIRADIYSLGATFYFCLTGRTPFAEGTVAQKLIWHQTRQPKSLRSIRPDVPDEVVAIIEKMMAKDVNGRFQTPLALAEALAPLTQTPIPPPPEVEMPQLSLAAQGISQGENTQTSMPVRSNPTLELSPAPRKAWQIPPSPNPSPAPAMATSPPPVPSSLVSPAPMPKRTSSPAMPTVGSLPPPSSTAAAPAPAVLSPATNPDPPSWEQLAPDTEDLTARLDTDRSNSKRRKGSGRKQAAGEAKAAPAKSRRTTWILVAGILAVATAAGVWGYLSYDGVKQDDKVKVVPIPVRPTLVVDSSGANGAFLLIGSAIQALPKGGNARILIKDDVLEAANYIINVRNVAIEPEAGKRFTWRAPTTGSPVAALLPFANAEGCKITGCNFEGGNKAESIIKIFNKCPGLTIEDCRFKDFTHSGIRITNAEGTADRPVQFINLAFATSNPAQRAIFFDLNASVAAIPINKYFNITRCTFDGMGTRIATPKMDPRFKNGFVEHLKIDPPTLAVTPEP